MLSSFEYDSADTYIFQRRICPGILNIEKDRGVCDFISVYHDYVVFYWKCNDWFWSGRGWYRFECQ